MNIQIPDMALVVLVGPTSSGKSTFAARHFLPTEVIASDTLRGMVRDDENSNEATSDAFELLHHLAAIRQRARRTTVVDATNLRAEDRASLVRLAKDHDSLVVAIVFDLPLRTLQERHEARTDRPFPGRVVRQHTRTLHQGLRSLRREGFHRVYTLRDEAEVDAATVERIRLWNDRRSETGPFDIVGDVHGCFDELCALLDKLGWTGVPDAPVHADGRKLVFLGDLVDRGPRSPDVLRLAMDMVDAGTALCVPGNHDAKLHKHLRGQAVKIAHGLQETIDQLAAYEPPFIERVSGFLDRLVSHYVLDGGALVVAHAGLKEAYQGRGSGRVRNFCLYGETTGETNEYGLPVRHDWAGEYRGRASVVYGHTPVPSADWVNHTICIDTGCVFGGKLSALRWPERELVDVPAVRQHYVPTRPLEATDERQGSDLLDLGDVMGRRHVSTRVRGNVAVRAENSAAALEVMSRFSVDPRWLVYLPPTMSPCATAPEQTPHLEHPREALAYYRKKGVSHVIVEEKHMGSRAVVVLCRDEDVGLRRFGVAGKGVLTSRTGRPFFSDAGLGEAVLERIRSAVERAGLFDELESDWLVIDAELLPWSAKAMTLLQQQYAPASAAGVHVLGRIRALLEQAAARGAAPAEVVERITEREAALVAYREAWRRYCWEVAGIDDLRLAPFHLLASEGRVHTNRDHRWHMDTLARLAAVDPWFVATPYQVVDLGDVASEGAAIAWWEALTAAGGEGAVVKPLDWGIGRRPPIQPAVKCRGREYLRIIYGPEYTLPDNLERLRSRGLGRKRALALDEYALGLEALHRFVEAAPLYRVHECVFGVLALESQPVDPRL